MNGRFMSKLFLSVHTVEKLKLVLVEPYFSKTTMTWICLDLPEVAGQWTSMEQAINLRRCLSSAKQLIVEWMTYLSMSLMKIRNKMGSRTVPRGKKVVTCDHHQLLPGFCLIEIIQSNGSSLGGSYLDL